MVVFQSTNTRVLLILATVGFGSFQNVDQNAADSLTSRFDETIYYRINWPGVENIDKLTDDKSDAKEKGKDAEFVVQDDNSIWITTAKKEKYHCILPKNDKELSASGDLKKIQSEKSPYQLLKPLFVREVCSYRLEQYWTYEMCHGRFIRQFHEESAAKAKSGATQEYYLGKYDLSQLKNSEEVYEKQLEQMRKEGKPRPTITVEEAQLPYIEINMTSGTLCDLSNTPRFTRVFYVCSEDSKHELHSIKETSTCEYEAVVLSPLLCDHPDFKITMAPEKEINCYPIGDAPDKPKGLKQIEEFGQKEKLELLKRHEEQQRKRKEAGFPDGIFDGKTIIIGASEFGKELRINIISEDPLDKNDDFSTQFDSKILQSFLSGDFCLHGGTGWWKYEFCYGKKVEQYHEEKGVKKTVITLGKWNEEAHLKWLDKNPSKRPKPDKTPRQVSHFYSDGDLCDVTGKTRQVEVKLKCRYVEGHPESVALYLMEPKTCEYILGIESPIICHLLSTVDKNNMLHLPEAPSDKLVLTKTEDQRLHEQDPVP